MLICYFLINYPHEVMLIYLLSHGSNNILPSNHHAGNDGAIRASDPAPKSAQSVKVQPIEVPVIPVEEIKALTDNFGSNSLIGEGSYGRVYYGVLENEKAAALKKLDASKQPDQEFLAQVIFCNFMLF